MLKDPKDPSAAHDGQHEQNKERGLMTAIQMHDIAAQLADFITNYDITVAEARIIANLVPNMINDQLTRFNASRDRQQDDL